MNPIYNIDFYKVGHVSQYHKDVKQVFSNWTPRSTRVAGATHIVNFGLSYFLQSLIEEFDREFFGEDWEAIESDYKEFMRATLGVADAKTDHLHELWNYGRLPLTFYALPEGALVPLGVPPIVVKNTNPGPFFWLPNYIETMMSNALWKASTSATTARRFREVFIKHAKLAHETDFSFVDWQGHDFSFRGMSGIEDAGLSGMGHLLMFSGTDTIPAIQAAHDYYEAPYSIGGSVPATEHSVMSAGSQEGEFETFQRLLTEVYPSGIVSIVSDTWDLWKVLTDYVPRLRDAILARDGKLVIRPDSGDPVKIMCGDPTAPLGSPAYFGAVHLLANALGCGKRGLINKGAVIYGDSISVERADEILTKVYKWSGLHPYNCIFGIGSYTYEYVTRDTYGWAMKATAYKDSEGRVIPIFKKPITDDGGKFSAKGIVAVYRQDGEYVLKQEATEAELDSCEYEKVFEDGDLLVKPTFAEVRARARRGL